MNAHDIDAMVAARRAELLATTTGRNIALEARPGGSLTPCEVARRYTAATARRHGSTAGYNPKDEA